MSLLAVNTVDRLDRPSAYYVGKVRESTAAAWLPTRPPEVLTRLQNKRRSRYNDRDEDEPEREDPMTKLKDATTLYVGNLYVMSGNAPVRKAPLTRPRSFYTTEEQIHELFSK